MKKYKPIQEQQQCASEGTTIIIIIDGECAIVSQSQVKSVNIQALYHACYTVTWQQDNIVANDKTWTWVFDKDFQRAARTPSMNSA